MPKPDTRRAGAPTWRGRVSLVLFGLVLGLGLAEGIVRAFHLDDLPTPRRVVYNGQSREWCCGPERRDEGVHRYEPGTSFAHCYSAPKKSYLDASNCVTYRINAAGYRGADFTIAKPAGVYRIVVLGDSFTFGEGTPEALIFPTLLAQAYAEREVKGRRVEVINLGMPAEDSGTEFTTYVRVAHELSPDDVIVQWNTNDFPSPAVQDDHLRLIGAHYREVYEQAGQGWSALLRFARLRWMLSSISRDLVDVTRDDAAKGAWSFAALERIRQAAASDGAHMTVLDFPELVRFDSYPYAEIVQRLRDFCASREIPLIDLLPDLSQHADHDLWVHETDHHPNPTAHAIAAAALVRELDLGR